MDGDTRMMRLAIEQARVAAVVGEVPIGAVIYRADEVLAAAHNQRETDHDPTAHAEIVVLRAAARRIGSWRLNGWTLAVTLEPCPMCAGAVVNSRLDRLVYGVADPKMGCVDTLARLCSEPRFNHRVEVRRGVLAEQCAELLQDFFRCRR